MTLPFLKTKFFLCALPIALALTGCERKTPRVYAAPKDRPFVPPQPAETAPPPTERHREMWRPTLTWTLPAGWEDIGPDAANVGRFAAGQASVAITALVRLEGQEPYLVNMWRQMRGQPPLDEAEAAKLIKDVTISGAKGHMFELTDTKDEEVTRFVVAFTHRPEGSLFFKIQGPDAVIAAQKPAFFEFLKTVKFSEGTASTAWPGKVPAGWTEVAPGPMQQAKFTMPEKDGAKAEVTVSVFPSETGGIVENVKRWRRQLKLADIPDDEDAKLAQPLPGTEGAVIVDLKNETRSLTGAIVPHDGQWFFIKLLGDAPAVAAAREAFVAFAKAKP